MKTDRFTDIIRRKLESIRPEFTDKDWARMQSTLNDANLSQPNAPGTPQPFSGGIWSSQPWLLAAASVSTVALIAFSVWQRREINQLRQTVGQLQTSTVQRPVQMPASTEPRDRLQSDPAQSRETTLAESREAATSVDRNGSQAIRPDTVYITRYVAVPSRAKPQFQTDDRLSQQRTTTSERQPVTEMPTNPFSTRQFPTSPDNQPTELHDALSTSPSVSKTTRTESAVAGKHADRSVKQEDLGNRATETPPSRQNTKMASGSGTDKTEVAATDPITQSDAPGTTETSANYELVIGRPLALSKKNWSVSLAQRARRMQLARPTPTVVVEASQAPESQPVKAMSAHFRAGVSGEVASRLWSVGIYTELLVGKHWSVGVGLNEATYLNRFITEDDFNGRTQRDFRREFGRGANAWGDILNIDTRQVRLQLPINIGYRIPLNQSLTFLTSVGTSLNLTSAENVTFYCRPPQFPPMQPQPQGGYTEVEASRSQSVALINNFALGAGIEWQRGHWIVQVVPVMTIPTQTDPKVKQVDLNWQQNVTAGLRARLLYQF